MNNRKIHLSGFALVAIAFATTLMLTRHEAIAQEASAQGAAQFARGAQTWADNCSRCHNMRAPKELRDDQWRAAVTHMRVRGNLTGQEARDVLAFLQASN